MNKVIVLDVDHTLVDAVKTNLGPPDESLCYIISNNYYVYLRPHVHEFIDYCFFVTPYVIIWSAGTQSYIEDIIKFLLDTYSFYRIITRSTYDTIQKNVDLLLTDNIVKSSLIIFIDDKPERIYFEEADVVILEIIPYKYKNNDNKLIEFKLHLELLLNC